MLQVLLLLLSFAVILFGAKLFTNAIEWLGLRLGLGEGAVGSVLAAVGTALPETLIAVVALISATAGSEAVAVGAIIGAPFMLATIAMVVIGVSALAFAKRRKQGSALVVNDVIGKRDLLFFVVAFSIAFIVSMAPEPWLRYAVAAAFVVAYLIYLYLTFKTEGALSEEHVPPLTFAKKREQPPTSLIILQLVASLALVVGGAHLFIDELIHIAKDLGADPLILSLLIAPLATELPEKANSVFWVRDGKDTLALGNVSGAMVFQSTIPVSIGLVFTEWQLDDVAKLSIALGVIGAVVAGAYLKFRKAIEWPAIVIAGILYLTFVAYVAFVA